MLRGPEARLRRVLDRGSPTVVVAPPPSPLARFIVRGTPKSANGPSGKRGGRWQQTVASAVPAHIQPTFRDLRLNLTFYFEGSTDLDVDNIIKPVADAIEGLIYHDDRQVVAVAARKIGQQGIPPLINPPPILIQALQSGGDFLLVEAYVDDLRQVEFP